MSENKENYLIDRARLVGKMTEHSLTRFQLAEKLGISYETLLMKLNKGKKFNETEIKILVGLFGEYIFFEKDC